MAKQKGGGGYCDPPKHSQFQKGTSGNPKGRPRGARGIKAELGTVLNERIRHPETGKSMSRRQMILRTLAARALRGHVAAADKILGLEIAAIGFDDLRQAETGLSTNDRLILEQLLGGSPQSTPNEQSAGEEPDNAP